MGSLALKSIYASKAYVVVLTFFMQTKQKQPDSSMEVISKTPSYCVKVKCLTII